MRARGWGEIAEEGSATASQRRGWLSQDLVDEMEADMGGSERGTF